MEPVTLAELKANFPDSTAEWREKQIEGGVNIVQAATNYGAFVSERAKAQIEQAKVDQQAIAAKQAAAALNLGSRPLTSDGAANSDQGYSGNPVVDFSAEVRKRIPSGGTDFAGRQAAIQSAASANPDMYRAYLETTNAGGGPRVKRLLAEKLAN